MDSPVLQAVLPAIGEELAGRPVTKAELVGKWGLLLRFGGSRRLLWISAHPELGRLGLVDAPPDLGEPRPAPDNLSEPLARARLAAVEQEAGGRVATLRFEGGEGRHRTPRLVCELIPRFANAILVGNDDRILWVRREFGGNRPRPIVPGRRYRLPAAEPGTRFADLDAAALAARLEGGEGPRHRRIPRGWGGGERGFARALEDAGDFEERLLALARAAATPAPRLARRRADGETVLFPADPGELPGWDPDPAAPANEVVDAWYRPREEAEGSELLLAELRRVLVKRRQRAAKALRQIEKRLGDAEREEEIRARAELLAAHLHEARRGLASVTLPAFDGSGDVEIPLDPKLDPQANVQALFKRARRLARGREDLKTQRAIQESEIVEVDNALAALDPAPDLDALRDLASRVAPGLLDGRRGRRGRGKGAGAPAAHEEEDAPKRSLPPGFNPRVYELPGGWEVWVGRSARQNDELTHRWAKPRDLWFHARGCQGSHAVLRIGSGKGEPPKEIVLAAAAIAAFHSKARHSNLVPVAYTEKRYVRKPRKSPVGTALMMREKVVMVAPAEPAPTA